MEMICRRILLIFIFIASLAEANSFYQKGDLKNLDSLNKRLKRAITPAERIGVLNEIADTHIEYFNEEALEYVDMVIDIAKQEGFQDFLLEGYQKKAMIYRNMGESEKSIEYFHEAEKLLILKGDPKELLESYYEIIEVYKQKNSTSNVLKYFNKILEIEKILSGDNEVARVYFDMGEYYIINNIPEAAITCYDKGVERIGEKGNKNLLFKGFLGKSEAFKMQKKYDDAESVLFKMQRLVNKNEKDKLVLLNMQKGLLQYERDDFQNCIKYLLWIVENSDEDNVNYKVALRYLAFAYEKVGDYKSALSFQRQYYKLSEASHAAEGVEAIIIMQERLDLKEKKTKTGAIIQEKEFEKKIVKQKDLLLKKQQKIIYVGAFLLGLSVILLVIVVYKEKKYKQLYKHLKEKDDDIKKIEKENVVTQDYARVAQEANESKSRFLANVVHDMRTSLNSLMGMVDLISESELTEEQREDIEIVSESSHDLLQLINDLLDLSKIEAGEVHLDNKPFNLRLSVEKVMKQFKVKVEEKDVELLLSFDEGMYDEYIGDAFRLRQVLINLVSNAVKFTSVGCVKLVIKPFMEDLNMIYFSIEDTGVGMANEEIASVFNPYLQVKDSPVKNIGTGLGLSISKNLVEMMGGRIEAESEKDKGSVFSFLLRLEHQP